MNEKQEAAGNAVKERPILFSGPMVRALLDGSKTQTRREFKARGWKAAALRALEFVHVLHGVAARGLTCAQPVDTAWAGFKYTPDSTSPLYFKCPYGQPGDRLWVREAWARTYVAQAGQEWVVYREGDNRTDYGGPWKPSIHMRRSASRILLEIVSVRVERLQEISENDARAEGVKAAGGGFWSAAEGQAGTTPRAAYALLWESINGADSWRTNPWVWVVEFKRVAP